MEQDPGAAEAVAGAASVQTSVPIEEMLPELARETERLGEVAATLDAAIGQAISLPGAAAQPATELGLIRDRLGGEVGRLREDIVSEAERPGVARDDPVDTDYASDVTDRFRALYVEMTNWQVAWSIAQRSQQDTNNLLRGM